MVAGAIPQAGLRGRMLRRLVIVPPFEPQGDPELRSRSRRRPGRLARCAIALGDAAVVTVVVAALGAAGQGRAWAQSAVVAGAMAIGFVMITAFMRGYRPSPLNTGEYEAVVRAAWVWGALVLLAGYFSDEVVMAHRGAGVAALALAIMSVLFGRAVRRLILRGRRRRGRDLVDTLLIGDPVHLRHLEQLFARRVHLGLQVSGVCFRDGADAWDGAPVLGGFDALDAVIDDHDFGAIVVSAGSMDAQELRRLCWRAEQHGIEVLLAPDVVDVAAERAALHSVAGTPLMSISHGSGPVQCTVKAAFDRGAALLLLALLLPVVIAGIVLIKFGSPGPAFFRQLRVGRNGRQFEMLKLRTMYIDAEERRDELLAGNEGNVVLFKLRQDPRVTWAGRVLRRYSIDELPQLWNVIRGEMSLVGPRPPLVREAAQYDDDVRQRLRVKPGMTGLWQVSGRSDLDWEETVRLDLYYADNWSIPGDIGILLRTFRAVVGGRGAY